MAYPNPSRCLLILSAVVAALCAGGAVAQEAGLRPSARLYFKSPELLKPGACIMYREGGAGWILTEPVYWLKGTVLASEVRTRKLDVCPEAPAKPVENYTRDEFNRLSAAYPCVSKPELMRDEQFGLVRFKVESWETPWAKPAANRFRLFQGHFLNRPLKQGMELELEADLLGACE